MAAVFSAAALYAAFATLRITINVQKQSNRLDFHHELRKAIVELNKFVDFILLGQVNEDLFNGDVSKAKSILIEQTRAFNNAARNLTLLMLDSDLLHENKKDQIERINREIIPYRNAVWNLTQYAIMREGIKKGSYGSMELPKIVASIGQPLRDIMTPYCNMSFEEFDKEMCRKLIMSVEEIDDKAIRDAFNEVYKVDAQEAYNYSFLTFSMSKRNSPEDSSECGHHAEG